MQANPLRNLKEEQMGLLVLYPTEYLTERQLQTAEPEDLDSFYIIVINMLAQDLEDAVRGSILVEPMWTPPQYTVLGSSADRGIGPWLYWAAMLTIYERDDATDPWLFSDDSLTTHSRRVWDRLVSDGWAVKFGDRFKGTWRGNSEMRDAIDQSIRAGRKWFQRMKREGHMIPAPKRGRPASKLGTVLTEEADMFFTKKYKEARLTANARSNDEVYDDWKKFVNMTARELEYFMDEYGDEAGLSRREAAAQGIRSGRDSARAIIRMKRKKKSEWTDTDWDWARRQVNFIKRMSGMKGSLLDEKGEPTRKYLALLVWGHDPLKGRS